MSEFINECKVVYLYLDLLYARKVFIVKSSFRSSSFLEDLPAVRILYI